METNAGRISLRTCMADGVKLFIKNIPFIVVFGILAHLLQMLQLQIVSYLRWNFMTVQMFGHQRGVTRDGFIYFLSANFGIVDILLQIVFNLITILGIVLVTAKSLKILRQDDDSFNSTFEFVRPNILKLAIVGTVIFIISRLRTFIWQIMFFLYERNIIDTIPRITMPWMRTRTRETDATLTEINGNGVVMSHGDTGSYAIVTEQIMAIAFPVAILMTTIGVFIFSGIGQYMIAHIVGKYEGGFIRGTIVTVKRTIGKMLMFATIIVGFQAVFLWIPQLIFIMRVPMLDINSGLFSALNNLGIILHRIIPFFSVTAFTTLFYYSQNWTLDAKSDIIK